MLAIQEQFIDYNHSDRYEQPTYIVIHDVGEVSSARNNRDYFAGDNRSASADFFIDSDNIIQIIDYTKFYSWAVGDGHGKYGITNSNSISIEMCLESNYQPSEATISNTIDLVKYLMTKYNIPLEKVVRHYDASRKICPCNMSANGWAKWYEFKSRLSGNTTPISVVDDQNSRILRAKAFIGNRCSELQEKLNKIMGFKLVVDGDFGAKTYGAVIAFQTKYALVVDGLFGEKSWDKIEQALTELNKPKPPIVSQPIDYSVKQLQYNLDRLFNFDLVCDNVQGENTNKAISFASKVYGVSDIKLLLQATNETLSFPLLKKGSKGFAVNFLQYTIGARPFDGVFGEITASRLRDYQSYKGISADSICGSETWKRIMT